MTGERLERREQRTAIALGGFLLALGVVAMAGASWATWDRWPVFLEPAAFWTGVLRPLLLVVLVLVPLLRPAWGVYLLFFLLPLFGNHPGGRLMEAINLPLGASLVGLTVQALRQRRPLPRHLAWVLGWGVAFSAVLALVPALPGILYRWMQVNDLAIVVAETLTSRETDLLYPLSSACLVVFAVGWATALAWVGAAPVRIHAWRALVIGLVLVTAVGILAFHRIIDLDNGYLLRLDPRSLDDPPYPSLYAIFWNPGWFAWYFSMAFGVGLGLILLESSWRRRLLSAVLVVMYGYFILANRQRGGVIAVHAAIAVVAAFWIWQTRRFRLAAAGVGAVAALVAIVLLTGMGGGERGLFTGVARLLSHPGDDVRSNLAVTALQMWTSSPVFGVGEGAFALRYREFVPVGDPLEVVTYGDAHNTWLQILATRGGLGFLVYVGLWVVIGRSVVRTWRARRAAAIPAVGALAAFFAYSFVQGMFYLQAIQVLCWGSVALLVVDESSESGPAVSGSQPAKSVARRPRRFARLGLAVLGGLLVAGAWWSNAGRLDAARQIVRVLPRGFYPVEPTDHGDGRWSSRAGVLCLYPTTPTTLLELHVAHPDLHSRPVAVTLSHDGTVLERVQFRRANEPVQRWVRLPTVTRAALRQSGRFGECRDGAVELRVEIDRVWSPASVFPMAEDTRHLGVFVSEIQPPPGTNPDPVRVPEPQ